MTHARTTPVYICLTHTELDLHRVTVSGVLLYINTLVTLYITKFPMILTVYECHVNGYEFAARADN
jgi:hypothetical protein